MDNISKILHYVTMVAKEPIVVDAVSYFKPKDHIKLQHSFFYTDGCNFCGGCDVPEDNVYTPGEYEWILNCPKSEFDYWGLDYADLEYLRSKLYEEVHTINGRNITFYVYDKDKNDMYLPTRGKMLPRCSWSKEFELGIFKCRIHPVVSLTCDMPHLRFTYSNNSTVSIGIQQFGRNWALKCPVKFQEPQTEQEFNENRMSRIRKLDRIDSVANELGVETWIPEIAEYIHKIPFDNYQEFLGKDCVTMHKKFFGREI